jgi:predicted MPP superfamily phosphohydrolase
VAVIAGGAWTGSLRQVWESIEVHDLAGTLLMKDEFDDPAAFGSQWENPGGRLSDFDETVVIAHNPGFLLGMPVDWRHLLDLVLAGHTHGGQVRLPFFGPLHLDPDLPRSWSAGWVRPGAGYVWMYVTRGLASTHVPVRFLCPPEVTDMKLIVSVAPPR